MKTNKCIAVLLSLFLSFNTVGVCYAEESYMKSFCALNIIFFKCNTIKSLENVVRVQSQLYTVLGYMQRPKFLENKFT